MIADVNADCLTYEEARVLAADPDPAVRRALALRTDIEPEILYFLAQDDDSEVRRTIAGNADAPRHTYQLLAGDQNEEVRAGLAVKIAELAPDLNQDERNKVWQSTRNALQALAHDQMIHVRQVLAETLSQVPNAPADIVGTLARDVETAVSVPVLESSPVLSDEDLLDIIRHGTASANLSAISRREQVSADVSDAIVETDDVTAIADLLANDSSQILEETLDMLIERAPDNELWHAPLANRPILPPKTPQRLATFLANHLLESLQSRTDFDDETLAGIKSAVKGRIAEAPHGRDDDDQSGGLFDFLDEALPTALVHRLADTSGLPASVVNSALNAGDYKFVLAALVVRSRVKEEVAKRIFRERNPEAIVSLIWRAKLPASLIVNVQKRMARIAPTAVMQPIIRDVDGEEDAADFPLNPQQMNNQLQFFADMVTRGGAD